MLRILSQRLLSLKKSQDRPLLGYKEKAMKVKKVSPSPFM